MRTAANRAVLPTEVLSEGIERYPSETEAAVYFCCLEAMQNAGKHAGAATPRVDTDTASSTAYSAATNALLSGAGVEHLIITEWDSERSLDCTTSRGLVPPAWSWV